jgi:hypothetical protein
LTEPSDPPRNRPHRRPEKKEVVTKLRHRIALVLALTVVPTGPAVASLSHRAPIVVRVSEGGFSWGVGAAGGSGLTLIVGGAVIGVRRKPHTTERSSSCTD